MPTLQMVEEKQDVQPVVCDPVLTIDLHKEAKSLCRNDSWSRIARFEVAKVYSAEWVSARLVEQNAQPTGKECEDLFATSRGL